MVGKRKAVLIDGHGLIHRAFHALPDLKTKDGQLINAVYGFSLILLNALKELKPDYVAVSFDLAKPTFRHKAFKEYKAKRAKTPIELSKQIPMVKRVVKSLNIPIFEAQGYEADDVIGTLAKRLTKENPSLQVYIVTGDLDILQLVDKQISVYTMRQGLTRMTTYTPLAVKERYGFSAQYLPDFKGMVGDASDNIPGVRGVGEKSAQRLIREYGSLEKIYQALEQEELEATTRTINQLKKEKEIAFTSRDLALIRCQVPIKLNLNQMLLADYNREAVAKLFSELEFKSLLDKLPQASSEQTQPKESEAKYQLIESRSQLRELKKQIKKKKKIVIDIETDTLGGKLIGISFAYCSDQAFYLPFLDRFKLSDIKDILEDEKIKKIGHGLKYDYRILLVNQVEFRGLYFDTLLAAHLLDPEKRNYKLDRLAFSELGREMIPLESLMGKDYLTTLDKVAVRKVKDYSCEDAEVCWQLYQKFKPKLKKRKIEKLFQEIELPLLTILAKMEERGIKIDRPYLEKLRDKTKSRLREVKKEIYILAGAEFNINSTQQLRKILFQRLKISSKNVRRTKTGLSTAASELVKLRGRHQIVALILTHRQLEKLRNTYLEPLLKMADRESRIHTNFNQTLTATGRLSSSKPNLQNIPTRTELGQEIRRGFISQRGFQLVSFDYSQIELRVAAHLSQDQKLIEAFKEGQDIHTLTAAELNDVEPREVTPEQRRGAKTVNFGVLYGMSPYGLAQALGQPAEYGREFIDNYFTHFSGVKRYLEEVKREVRKRGYTETLFGRRRYFNLENGRLLPSQLERAAINTPIQGTAADLIKKAMVIIDQRLPETRLLLQVHDELVFEIPTQKVKREAKKIQAIMEKVIKLSVPLEVDVKYGESWEGQKKLKG